MASSAHAADLDATRASVPTAVVASAFAWTGFYAGAHVGYGWGYGASTTTGGLVFPGSGNGGLFGGQLGVNYQIGQFVLGLEADLAYAAIGRHSPLSIMIRNEMLGSVRARAGFAHDRLLVFVTGGPGITRASFTATAGPETATRSGWAVGGGGEYALTQNWTVRAEYIYYNFGTRPLGLPYAGTMRNSVHTVKLGVNYLFSTAPSAVVARH